MLASLLEGPRLAVLGLTGPVWGAVALAAGVGVGFILWKRRCGAPREIDACRAEMAALFVGKRDVDVIAAKARLRLATWKADPATAACIRPALAELAKQIRDAHAYEAYGLAHVSASARSAAYAAQSVELQKIFGVCVVFGGWADLSTIDLLLRLTRLQGDAGEYEEQVRLLERTCAEGLALLPEEVAAQVRRELDYAIVLRTAKQKATARISNVA